MDVLKRDFEEESNSSTGPLIPTVTQKEGKDKDVIDEKPEHSNQNGRTDTADLAEHEAVIDRKLHEFKQEYLEDPGNNMSVTMETEKSGDDRDKNADMLKDYRQPKKKGKKGRNPFMPRKFATSNTVQGVTSEQQEGRNSDETETSEPIAELAEFVCPKLNRVAEKFDEDVDGLMEWWSTVERWDDLPARASLSEREETKAFAVTAEKVRKGIRVFNKLFVERAEDLWQHVIDLHAIADGIDRFNKKAKIAAITGGSTSAVGGVATIAGLALAPVTLGTSLIVTAVGLGVATAGGLTSASAGISSSVNNSLDRKKVEKIVEDYQAKMADVGKCLKFIKQGIEHLCKYDVVKMKKRGYKQDFPDLGGIYKDGIMAGKAIVCNAAEIMRVSQVANVAGSTAARAVQVAGMATGVLTGLFVAMDIYFVAKDSCELRKGAKSEFAAKIREVANQLHDGLVELNSIRQELQEASSHS